MSVPTCSLFEKKFHQNPLTFTIRKPKKLVWLVLSTTVQCHENTTLDIYTRPRQTFLTEEPKNENNSLREPENNFIEKFI